MHVSTAISHVHLKISISLPPTTMQRRPAENIVICWYKHAITIGATCTYNIAQVRAQHRCFIQTVNCTRIDDARELLFTKEFIVLSYILL
jgi:hypothetical protein